MRNFERITSVTPEVVGYANAIPTESIDCGITAVRCCNTPWFQKFATPKIYMILFTLIGIIQGAIELYFIVCVRQTALEHSLNQKLVDWLLVSNGIAQGILAIFVAYWGNRIHRISWISGITIIQSSMLFLLIIPILVHNSSELNTLGSTLSIPLCLKQLSARLLLDKPHILTTVVLLFVLQLGIALGNIVYITLGISYLDDNVMKHQSPGMIGAALAAKHWGPQLGHGIAFGISASPFGWWLGWAILAPILFFLGTLFALFPKRLPNSIVKDVANVLVENFRENSETSFNYSNFLANPSFSSSLKRLFSNKILMINIIATVFIQTAIVNYFYHDQNYLQSRFYFPAIDDYYNDWTSRILYNVLKPPIVALSILVSGLIIAKTYPSSRKLAAWNVITGTLCMLFFIGYLFINCDSGTIAGSFRQKLTKPLCASSCVCPDSIPFSPVCPENSVQTYYSPCHAGCTAKMNINNIQFYTNCSCGIDTHIKIENGIATDGACKYVDCQIYWILFQILTILAASLLGSGLVGNLIISLRCVLPQDKSLALSLELAFLGMFVYIPGKFGYDFIADSTCQLRSDITRKCYLHDSSNFGNTLNIVTATLIGIGVIFDMIVFMLVKDLRLYDDSAFNDYQAIPLNTHSTVQNHENPTTVNATANNNENNNNSNNNNNNSHNINNNNNNNNNSNNNNNNNNSNKNYTEVDNAYHTPYGVSPIVHTTQNTSGVPVSYSDHAYVEKRPTSTLPPNRGTTSSDNTKYINNYPDEDIPLNFNLQTVDWANDRTAENTKAIPGMKNHKKPRGGYSSDSDSEFGVRYTRLILPSQMKEIVKRHSTNPKLKNNHSPETDF